MRDYEKDILRQQYEMTVGGTATTTGYIDTWSSATFVKPESSRQERDCYRKLYGNLVDCVPHYN